MSVKETSSPFRVKGTGRGEKNGKEETGWRVAEARVKTPVVCK